MLFWIIGSGPKEVREVSYAQMSDGSRTASKPLADALLPLLPMLPLASTAVACKKRKPAAIAVNVACRFPLSTNGVPPRVRLTEASPKLSAARKGKRGQVSF